MANIFITGATGFLGWNIVRNLLEKEDSKLYILVRRNPKEAPKQRITNLIDKSYDSDKRRDVFNMIEVIEGDITRENLGIDGPLLERLYSRIDTIYHAAALCEFGVPLGRIRKINVFGTENVLEFALGCKRKGQFKSFHHISTVAVLGKFGGIFYEDALDVNQEFNNTYEQSKFEAEKLVEEYRKKGMSISIYRPGIITGDSVSGEVSNFQMFYQPLHFFSLEIFDQIPANRKLNYSLVPVDYVAKAICLVSSSQNNNKNYHLSNPNFITLDFMLDVASSYFGFKKPKILLEQDFDFRKLTGFRRKLLEPYLPYLNHKEVEFDTANFNKAIGTEKFSWPVINKDLLKRLFKYCVDVDYIRRLR